MKKKQSGSGSGKQNTLLRMRFGKIRVLFEDDYFIAVDKPPGLLVVATRANERKTLYRVLNEYLSLRRKPERIFIVHRLDRDTSGIVLFAKTYKEKLALQDFWQSAVSDKIYYAVAEGRVVDDAKTIRSYLTENKAFKAYSTQDRSKGKEAVTSFETVSRGARYSLLRVRLVTGRKNQIRAHLAEYGHPVAGDWKYGAATNPLRRVCLHACALAFIHPVTKKRIELVSEAPDDFFKIAGMRFPPAGRAGSKPQNEGERKF